MDNNSQTSNNNDEILRNIVNNMNIDQVGCANHINTNNAMPLANNGMDPGQQQELMQLVHHDALGSAAQNVCSFRE
jgi:hypothetical protein